MRDVASLLLQSEFPVFMTVHDSEQTILIGESLCSPKHNGTDIRLAEGFTRGAHIYQRMVLLVAQ